MARYNREADIPEEMWWSPIRGFYMRYKLSFANYHLSEWSKVFLTGAAEIGVRYLAVGSWVLHLPPTDPLWATLQEAAEAELLARAL